MAHSALPHSAALLAFGTVVVVAGLVGVMVVGNPSPTRTPATTGLATPSAATPSRYPAIPSPTASPTQFLTAPPSAPSSALLTWPTVTPSAAVVPSKLDQSGRAFWTFQWSVTLEHPAEDRLRVGTLDGGEVARVAVHFPGMAPLDVSLQPMPAGPAGGRVLYVIDDGHQATLHVISAADGEDRALISIAAFIAGLAIDPSGTTAYYLVLDRSTSTPIGVEAISTDGGAPRPVMSSSDIGAGEATSPIVSPGEAGYLPSLAISMDGRWVVLTSCRPTGCDLVAAPADAGSLERWQSFDWGDEMVGVVGDLVFGSSDCDMSICDGFVIDLRSGQRWALGGDEGAFEPRQLITGPHGPLVLGEQEDVQTGKWQVEALDLTDRTRETIFAASFRPAWTAVGLMQAYYASAGADLPPGWFLIIRNANAAPALYPHFTAGRIGGDAEIPLPAMTFPQD